MNTVGWAIVFAAVTWEAHGRVTEMNEETRIITGGLLLFILSTMFLTTMRDLFR